MGVAGPKFGGTSIDEGGASESWAGVSNVFGVDSTYASISLGAGNISPFLTVTNFGFSIPTNGRIDGIQVRIRRSSLNPTTIADLEHRIVKNGIKGPALSENIFSGLEWPTTDTFVIFGGLDSYWGFTTWTAADINASDFGIAIKCRTLEDVSPGTARIDSVEIIVFYATPKTTLDLSYKSTQTLDGVSSSGKGGGL